ncbi:unnamed protein product, partial [Didymodactylos carnosus]
RGIFRDVLIVINGGISDIPTKLMQSVPFVKFDLNEQKIPSEKDITEIMFYLDNMNIVSNNYTEFFPSIEGLLEDKDI